MNFNFRQPFRNNNAFDVTEVLVVDVGRRCVLHTKTQDLRDEVGRTEGAEQGGIGKKLRFNKIHTFYRMAVTENIKRIRTQQYGTRIDNR